MVLTVSKVSPRHYVVERARVDQRFCERQVDLGDHGNHPRLAIGPSISIQNSEPRIGSTL